MIHHVSVNHHLIFLLTSILTRTNRREYDKENNKQTNLSIKVFGYAGFFSEKKYSKKIKNFFFLQLFIEEKKKSVRFYSIVANN